MINIYLNRQAIDIISGVRTFKSFYYGSVFIVNIDAGTFTGAFEFMKLFYILIITRLEICHIMHEDITTLEIDDKRKYMLISLSTVIYLDAFTQLKYFPNLIK